MLRQGLRQTMQTYLQRVDSDVDTIDLLEAPCLIQLHDPVRECCDRVLAIKGFAL